MKLLVLGASGGCGRWLVRLAAERGCDVTAVVRPSAQFVAPSGVRVHRTELWETDSLEPVLEGHDAVLSCLGLRRAGPSPWAALQSPPDLTARVTRRLIGDMRKAGVRRVVAISAGGVGESVSQLSWSVQRLIRSGNVAVAYRDLEGMERELAGSELDWLAVRPVTLTNGPPTGRAKPVKRYGLMSMVRRSDVAAWMLGQVEQVSPFPERRVLLGTG